MTQKEFETRTGKEITSGCFDYANRVYMAAGEMDKDSFCQEYFSKKVFESDIVCNLTMEVENLRGTVKNLERQIRNDEENLTSFRNQMVDFLILQAEKWSATDLREKAIKIVGIKEYIRLRLEMKLGLWESDRQALLQLLKED